MLSISWNYGIIKCDEYGGTILKIRSKAQSFMITVRENDDKIWQGDITWIENNRTQQFRSALELLNLINSALEDDREEEKKNEIL